jgi:sulfur relay protein TusB/DsrH
MGTLHVVMTPLALTLCLCRANAGDAVLLMEDGVLGQVPTGTGATTLPSFFIYEAHRLRRGHLCPAGVHPIDMVGFVRLTESHPRVVRWY